LRNESVKAIEKYITNPNTDIFFNLKSDPHVRLNFECMEQSNQEIEFDLNTTQSESEISDDLSFNFSETENDGMQEEYLESTSSLATKLMEKVKKLGNNSKNKSLSDHFVDFDLIFTTLSVQEAFMNYL
jgi:hypothetical protein